MYLGYQNGKIKFYTEEPLEQEFYNLDKLYREVGETTADRED